MSRYAHHFLLVTTSLMACASDTTGPVVERRLAVLPQDTLRMVRNRNGVEVAVRAGGFGSALAIDQGGEIFYLLTDRGPNVDGPLADSKIFPVPGYTPRIGRFRIVGGDLLREGVIELRAADGMALSGLPTAAGPGATGETALGLDQRVIPAGTRGIDAEGLAVLPDGTFWVAEEYGPSLLHFDSGGREIGRISPGSDSQLPAVLIKRRPNYGIEALAATPSGRLAVMLQSPLYNPEVAGRSSRAVRLLVLDPGGGAARQYVYELDHRAYVVSAVAAASDEELLVVERDDLFPLHPQQPSRQKRVYRISLEGATDISEPADHPTGRLWLGKTLEELDDRERDAAGIVPVKKALAFDLLSFAYPHDKPEGIALLGDGRVAIANDDDFGVVDGEGGIVAKVLPATGDTDRNEVWIIRP